MNFEYFIARGFSRSRGAGRPNIMIRIASLSVTVGVAAMIVTLAVTSGFEREIEARLTGFTGHVRVSASGVFSSREQMLFVREESAERILRETEGFRSMDSYLQKSAIVKSAEAVEGLLLKGYDGDGGAFFERCLSEGSMPRTGDSVRYKDILISQVTADRLDVGTGDRIELLFIDEGSAPRRDRFTVSGIYASGIDESDRLLALTDIRNIRRLTDSSNPALFAGGMPSSKSCEEVVSGYEVLLDRFGRAEEYADSVNEHLFYDDDVETPLAAESIRSIYPAVFDWQNTHDVNAAVIIALMLVVALFNTVSALLIMVLERTRSVGVLKALGTGNRSLQGIFMWRAVFVVLRGVAAGDIAGIGLCLAQKLLHIIRLDPSGYILAEMPVHIAWWHIPLIDAAAVAVITAGLLIPARIVSSIHPEEAVRYE
ncbi:MAG: ABC transporter permease [Alistipes sp.]|nr:ABC transporter permease [Alistipes sp.]